MKLTQKCPKCEGREFAVNPELRQPKQSSTNETVPLPAVTVSGRRKSLGWLETWMCLACGYTEFYAGGLDGVRELAAQHPEQLRIVNATGKDGPYREASP